MSVDSGFTCSCCGGFHAELPMAFHAEAPFCWSDALAGDSSSVLGSDQCVIEAESYFVRGLIEIPVLDSDDVFAWGVWVSLSRENFGRAADLWETDGREAEPPYFGWLSTELSVYSPTTINLKTHMHTRRVGQRPFIELEPTGHPLAVEQRTGITLDRVREIAEAVMHPDDEAATP